MTEPHTRAKRHPTYTTAYGVRNWPEYDKALRDRGDITRWISQDAINAWTPPQTGKRGAQPVYADIAIETALSLRWLLHLPLRQTEGFLGSVLNLMDVSLPCPDHTTRSRRHATVAISGLKDRRAQGPVDLVVDSRGLQVCGQGAWQSQQHGEKTRQSWKTLHIGVDDEGWIIASTVTDDHAQDPSHVPALLAQVDRELGRFIGDGIDDQAPVYAAVEAHAPGARVIIPPRKDAALRAEAATSPTQRDRHLSAMQRTDRFVWKRTSGSYDQSHADNAFSRYKRTFGGGLRAKRDDAQEREAVRGCVLLNRMRERGCPPSSPVNYKRSSKGNCGICSIHATTPIQTVLCSIILPGGTARWMIF